MDSRNQLEYTLFVSYAHEDRKMVEELRKPFIPLERRYGCKLFWDDSRIRTGDVWLQQIRTAMAEARAAVLLLSSGFLVSYFIDS